MPARNMFGNGPPRYVKLHAARRPFMPVAFCQGSGLLPWPNTHSRRAVVKEFDARLFKDGHKLLNRIRANPCIAVAGLHLLYRSQRDFGSVGNFLLRPV